MMHEVRTFRARTLHDALNVVRRELGSHAVILATRQTPISGFWPWGRRDVEVLAQRDTVATAPASIPVAASAPSFARHAPAPVQSPAPVAQENPVSIPAIEERLRPNPNLVPQTIPATPAVAPTPHANFALPANDIPEPESRLKSQANQDAAVDHWDPLTRDLLNQLTSRMGTEIQPLPGSLESLRLHLIQADVPQETARNWVNRLRREIPGAAWENPTEALTKLTELLEREFLCTGGIRVAPRRRKIVALVGPTGVGKSTTIAKLAAQFTMRNKLRVGLLTMAPDRTGHPESLQRIARLMGLPNRTASTESEVQAALAEFENLDLVLIDTPGQSPSDDLERQELKQLLTEAQVDEVHLVLSLAGSMRSNLRAIQKLTDLGARSLILTKMDEAGELGQLVDVLPELTLPISYLTTGQNVSNDLEPAVSSRLARRILGVDAM